MVCRCGLCNQRGGEKAAARGSGVGAKRVGRDTFEAGRRRGLR
jgi:hypothetical protein